MAFPTTVNDQVTDSITQANTKVLGDSPAMALSNLYVATSQALSMLTLGHQLKAGVLLFVGLKDVLFRAWPKE